MIVSKVIEIFIENGKRVVKLLRFGKSDSINTYLFSSFGDDFNVPAGYKALFIKTSNSSDPICVGFLNKVILNGLNSGDKQIFSTDEDGNNVAAYLKFINDGIININGDTDFVAGFTDLKAGFDNLTSDLNDLITAFNAHMHATAATGAPSPPTPIPNQIPAIPTTASIDDCKKDNIKTE